MSQLELAVNHAVAEAAKQRIAYANAGTGNTKRGRLYEEFGYPIDLTFDDYYKLYERNSIAGAAIDIINNGCWEDFPEVFEGTKKDDSTGNSNWDKAVNKMLKKYFPIIKEADKRGMVGNYSAILIQFKDNQEWDKEVNKSETKKTKMRSIVRLIPVWENQLSVAEWDQDVNSVNYGYPLLYEYTSISGDDSPNRTVTVHPERIIILCESSVEGLITNGVSKLKKGFNDALDLEKVSGGAAEGFLKNSSRQLNINFSKDVEIDKIAQIYGVEVDKLANAVDEQIKKLNTNTDSSVIMQDGSASVLSVAAADPQPAFNVSLSKFAASVQIPLKVLIGQITGERASTEDNRTWGKTRMSRRNGFLSYLIDTLLRKMINFGVIDIPKDDEITISWSDLLAPSHSEKLENASKLADIATKTMTAYGEAVIKPNEIRAAAEMETLDEFERDNVDDPKGDPLDDESGQN